ncbi:MAG: MASE3 domain-containing protein, partial [Thiohalomonadaceae bacterium]
FHSLAELFAVGVAVTVFAVAWNTYPFTRSSFLLYLGCGYLWVAGFDLIHTLVYEGMGVLPITGANTATQLWVAGRLFEATLLLTASFAVRKHMEPSAVLAAGGAVFLGVCALIYFGLFPTAYVQDVGLTPFKVYAEYTVVLILLLASAMLWRRRDRMDAKVNRLILAAVGLTVIAEFAFTQYVEIVSVAMAVGHLFKFWSYWLIYLALVQFTLRNPFQILGRHAGTYDAFAEPTALVDRAGTIRQANSALRRDSGELEPVGRPAHTLLHPQGLARDRCPVCEAIAAARPSQGLELFYPERGQWREIALTPFYWSSRVVGMVHVARDVTARHRAAELLAEERDRVRDYLNVAEVMLVALDREGRVLSFNRKAASVTGWSEQEVLGRDWFAMLPATEQVAARTAFGRILDGTAGQGDFHEGTLVTRNGEERLVAWRTAPLMDGQGRVSGALISGEDVTQRRRDEARLRQAAAVYETSAEGVIITDAEFRVVAVNPAFRRITGFTEADLVGSLADATVASTGDGQFTRVLRQQLRTEGSWQGEIRHRRKSGETFPAWEHISALRDSTGKVTHYIAVLTDITPIKASEERLDRLAHHDPLTGRPNRLLFHARATHALDRAVRDGNRVGILFADLDRFKQVNDTFGHEVGDRLLVEAAARMEACVRSEDTVARMGGDEFTVLLEPLQDAADAGRVAQKLVDSLHRPFHLDGQEITVGASVGISIYPEHGRDLETLLKKADAAMYRVKEQGRNNYQFYTEDLTTITHERLALEAGLRQALERAELVLHYQPVAEAGSGRVFGVEGLMRWRHPDKGVLLPERFLPIAEQTGLIGAMDQWALRTACAQGREWHRQGLKLRVAVNLSGKWIGHGDSVQEVGRILAETEFDPHYLVLEIAEGWLMSRDDDSVEWLRELKDLGVQLAVDRFGAGYTSLRSLKRFPVDRLKIDPAMVAHVTTDADDGAMVRAIIALAHSLDVAVTATGVSTGEQLDFLRAPGHNGQALAVEDEYQGFLCQPPLPAEQLGPWLRESRRAPDSLRARE